jgi:hypothetical protein
MTDPNQTVVEAKPIEDRAMGPVIPGSVETWMGVVRAILAAIGGILVTLGIMTSGDVATWTSLILTVVGALLPAGVTVWSTLHHVTKDNPNVKTVA